VGVEVETSEAHKVTNLDTAWALDDDEAATSIGYGGTGEPVAGTEVVLLGTNQVWHHTTATGWVNKTSGLPSEWTWKQVATNPLNPDDWLVIGDDGTVTNSGAIESDGQPVLWRTTDAGATWSGVAMPAPAGAWGLWGEGRNQTMGYTATGDLFVFHEVGSVAVLWRGTSSPLNALTPVGTSARSASSACAGVGGEIVLSYATGINNYFGWVAAGGTTATETSGVSLPNGWVSAAGVIGARRIWIGATNTGDLVHVTLDYRSPAFTAGTAGLRLTIAGSADGNAYTRDASNVNRLVRVAPDGSTETAYTATFSLSLTARADAQTRTALFALEDTATNPTVVFSEDSGATWQTMPGPTATNLNRYQGAIIVRE
jgi:hypothetical protein